MNPKKTALGHIRATLAHMALFYFLSGCAVLGLDGLTGEQRAELKNAIIDNDVDRVEKILNISTKTRSQGPIEGSSINEGFGQDLLSDALWGTSGALAGPDGKCRTNVVATLIRRGAKPGKSNILAAAKTPCSDIMGLLLANASNEVLVEASDEHAGTFLDSFKKGHMPVGTLKIETTETMKLFITALNKSCTQNGFSTACEIAQKCQLVVDSIAAFKRNQENSERYRHSPAGILEQACLLNAEIDATKKILEEEKQSATISGFVDKQVMYHAGKKIQKLTNQLDEERARYKGIAKQPIDLKKCAAP